MSVNAEGQPTSYKCQISEYQRNMLDMAITAAIAFHSEVFQKHPADPNFGSPEDTMVQELQTFQKMLQELPEQERACPGVLYGLCL